MTWQDRIREAAYTSPSGERKTFTYEDLSRSIDKKTTGFDFPDAPGTYVQDNGPTGQKFPVRVIFWGADCDLDATEFEALLTETGVGQLEHPIYGVFDVVPFGSITRRDDLKTAANQAVIQVTFWETTGLVYPSNQKSPADETLTAVDDYNSASAESFEDGISTETALERVTLKSQILGVVDSVKAGLQTAAEAQKAVQDQFDAVTNSINAGIDLLVSQPLTLAFQVQQMIQAPARAASLIRDRLSAYGNLLDSIISGGDEKTENSLRTNDLVASTYITGSIISVVNNQFETKTEALEAAETIIDQFNSLNTWRDTNFETLGVIETGEAYQQLQNAVSTVAGFLVEISFTLKQEKTLVLGRNRTIIDLVAELYGAVDSELDFFINSNDLTGSEILELPVGKEVVYYV